MAIKTEKNRNNNNIFNGKNVSDNSKVTNFYALKAQTAHQSQPLDLGKNGGTRAEPVREVITHSNIIKHLFTGDVATSKCDDCRDQAAPPTKVSNLL